MALAHQISLYFAWHHFVQKILFFTRQKKSFLGANFWFIVAQFLTCIPIAVKSSVKFVYRVVCEVRKMVCLPIRCDDQISGIRQSCVIWKENNFQNRWKSLGSLVIGESKLNVTWTVFGRQLSRHCCSAVSSGIATSSATTVFVHHYFSADKFAWSW